MTNLGPRTRRWRIPRRIRRRLPGDALVVGVVLTIGTAVVAGFEQLGVNDASATFLLAVVAAAVWRGTGPAVATAVGAFLIYDFLFIEPRYTLTVNDPGEWLTLLLLLFVGVVVGRLAGQERDRAERAIEGERRANALFRISYLLATRPETASVLDPIAEVVRDEVGATRVWITVDEALAADTTPPGGDPPPDPTVHTTLRRRPGDEPAEWVRVHAPGRPAKGTGGPDERVYRVAIAAGGRTFGAIWVTRRRDLGQPDASDTRIISAAADQIGGALERDALHRDATVAEISRRSEALKSALLDSVSHDLRTPLATIRAAAGSLMDPDVAWPPEQAREIAASIDREATWLNRLVTNLLDMSRVEAGELKPSLAACDLAELVATAVARSARGTIGAPSASSGEPSINVDVPDDLPPVLVDEVFMGQILANLVDNAAKYAGPAASVQVSAHPGSEHRVRVTVEDDGPGVPPEALPRLFEKFYRVPRRGEGSRRGTGIGLAVVRGLVDAMGGTATARSSALGGLAIDLDLPMAAPDTAGEDADADGR